MKHSIFLLLACCLSGSVYARSSTMRGLFGGGATGAVIGGLAGGGKGAGYGALGGAVLGTAIGASEDARRRRYERRYYDDYGYYDDQGPNGQYDPYYDDQQPNGPGTRNGGYARRPRRGYNGY